MSAESHEVVELLVAAFRRASRREHPAVGTEHVLHALLEEESAAGRVIAPGMRLSGALMGVITAKGADHWASDDGGHDEEPDTATAAVLREAAWLASKKTAKVPEQQVLPTGALVAAVRRSLVNAQEFDVSHASPTHLLMGLLHDPDNRACEALLERRLDRDEILEQLSAHSSARQEGTPHADAVTGLVNTGALTRRGPFWAALAKKLVSGSLSSPMLPTVRLEARRQAARLGHPSASTTHLLLGVLAVDEQLAATGDALREELAEANAGGQLLRSRGVTLGSALALAASGGPDPSPAAPSEEPEVESALTRARLRCSERQDASAGTAHLLAVLLEDADGPVTELLTAFGVDTDELAGALAAEAARSR